VVTVDDIISTRATCQARGGQSHGRFNSIPQVYGEVEQLTSLIHKLIANKTAFLLK